MEETLGIIKDDGRMPTATQIFFLEHEAAKNCGAFGYPHRYHCYSDSTNRVHRDLCWGIKVLHSRLTLMFPGIELSD